MAQIIVVADSSEYGEDAVMWRERITHADLESEHFQAQLLQRVGWAVNDARAVEARAVSAPVAGEFAAAG